MLHLLRETYRPIRLITIALAICTCSGPSYAAHITLERVFDDTSPIPGTSIPIQEVSGLSYDHGSLLAVAGNFDQVFWELFRIDDGTVTVIANFATPIPGGDGVFRSFYESAQFQTESAFIGSDEAGRNGVYTTRGGGLQVVVDWQTPQPGGVEAFSIFHDIAMDEGRIAFFGSDSNLNEGLYSVDSTGLTVLADWTTPIPGTPYTFSSFVDGCSWNVAADSGQVAFVGLSAGSSPHKGIYLTDGTSIQALVDNTMPVPGGATVFDRFCHVSLDAGHVAFAATTQAQPYLDGVYLYDGALVLVAHETMDVPGHPTGFMRSLDDVTLDAGNIVFTGGFSVDNMSYTGLYLYWEGTIQKVIDGLDILDGKPIWEIFLPRNALSGRGLVFTVQFLDGTQAVYLAHIDDCNRNGIYDGDEIANGTLTDIDGNGIPDECVTPTIPAVSEWGLLVCALVVPLAGTAILRRCA